MPRNEPGWLVRQLLRHRGFTETLQRWRYRKRWIFQPPVLGVHSPPRTGSVSVVRALRRALGHRRILHLHYMNPATIEENYKAFDAIFDSTGQAGLHVEYLAAELLSEYRSARAHHERVKLVTLVRDPMARTVSAFFKQFTLDHPGMNVRFLADPGNLDRLREMFLDPAEPQARVTLEWLDKEVKAVFGIDVFAEPFPRHQGYHIFSGADCDLLAIRLEDALRVGPAALQALLHHPAPIPMEHENSTSQREIYSDNYRRFVETLRLPEAYLNRLYDSRLARHFYATEEIAAMRARWRQLD